MKYGILVKALVIIVSLIVISLFSVQFIISSDFNSFVDDIKNIMSDDEIHMKEDEIPEEEIYKPSYSSLNTSDRFANIYDNYNDTNAELLKDSFSDFLESAYSFEGNEQSKEAFSYVVNLYVEEIFETVKNSRETENSASQSNELRQKFITDEAQAFDTMYSLVEGILVNTDDYKPTNESVEELVELVASSDSTFNTLKKINENDEVVEAFSNGYQLLDEDIQQTIKGELTNQLNISELDSERESTVLLISNIMGIEFDKVPSL